MDAVRTHVPDTVALRRDSDYTFFVRLHLSGGRRYTKFVCVRSVFVRVQRGGNFARHLPFGTLTAVASCIVVTFTINFIQCYWQMYRVTFRQKSCWPFIRQLISPLVISILIALVLIPMQYALEGMNIFVTIIAKGIVSFIIFGIYIQMT